MENRDARHNPRKYAPPAPPVVRYADGSIAIPTQPQDMGKALESKKREEIIILVILMLLAVLITVGAWVAVTVLRSNADTIFEQVENAGVSISKLESFPAFGKITIGGKLAIGILLAIVLLSRGATTVLMMILWGLAGLVTALVTIVYCINTSKTRPAKALDIGALITGWAALLVSVYIPYEIAANWRSLKYWIPGDSNRISFWVMLPAIVWGIYLIIYFITAVISMTKKNRAKPSQTPEDIRS